MCVKTKTDWSCGCSKKALSTCDDAPNYRDPCSQVQKFRYLDDGDCKECRAGGANVTRGQDGLGRYAREIAARERKAQRQSPRSILGEITGNGSQADSANEVKLNISPIVTPTPWMRSTRREKAWGSPHRRHADEAWVREHAQVKEDIESLYESHSASPRRKESSRHVMLPYEPALPYEVTNHSSSNSSSRLPSSSSNQSRSSKQFYAPMAVARPLRPQQNSRQDSYDSIDSIPSRGRTRTLPVQYGYASNFSYAVETRAPKNVYAASPSGYRR